MAEDLETQIVVQWLNTTPAPSGSAALETLAQLTEDFSVEQVLEENSDGLYWVDGNDFGGGTYNVFLYSSDPDAAVRKVIELFEMGQLRPGMRIGVAEYLDEERTNWKFRPAFPEGLETFDIMY